VENQKATLGIPPLPESIDFYSLVSANLDENTTIDDLVEMFREIAVEINNLTGAIRDSFEVQEAVTKADGLRPDPPPAESDR